MILLPIFKGALMIRINYNEYMCVYEPFTHLLWPSFSLFTSLLYSRFIGYSLSLFRFDIWSTYFVLIVKLIALNVNHINNNAILFSLYCFLYIKLKNLNFLYASPLWVLVAAIVARSTLWGALLP